MGSLLSNLHFHQLTTGTKHGQSARYTLQMMPLALQYFSAVNPMSYVVNTTRGSMITGDLSNLLADLAAIAAFDIVMFILASISFKRIIE